MLLHRATNEISPLYISGAEFFDLHRIINKAIGEGADKISRKQLTSLFDIKFALEKDLRFFDAGEVAFNKAMDGANIPASARMQTKIDLKSFMSRREWEMVFSLLALCLLMTQR